MGELRRKAGRLDHHVQHEQSLKRIHEEEHNTALRECKHMEDVISGARSELQKTTAMLSVAESELQDAEQRQRMADCRAEKFAQELKECEIALSRDLQQVNEQLRHAQESGIDLQTRIAR